MSKGKLKQRQRKAKEKARWAKRPARRRTDTPDIFGGIGLAMAAASLIGRKRNE